MRTYRRGDLLELRPRHEVLVGIDSDGCVFDTMGVKQRECFHPEIIRAWGLEGIEPALREVAEFVNLHSPDRGSNRFVALLRLFELLPGHPGAAGAALPPTGALRRFVESGRPLTHDTLGEMLAASGDPELRRILDWSQAVNRAVAQRVRGLAPFAGAREALARMADSADVVICTQTPEEAVIREWEEHGLDRFVRGIAGPALGTKAEHLELAGRGRYAAGRRLMIGDAPGDLRAACQAATRFYPILPGREVESWRRLLDEGYERFLADEYAGWYETERIAEFEAALLGPPPWAAPPAR